MNSTQALHYVTVVVNGDGTVFFIARNHSSYGLEESWCPISYRMPYTAKFSRGDIKEDDLLTTVDDIVKLQKAMGYTQLVYWDVEVQVNGNWVSIYGAPFDNIDDAKGVYDECLIAQQHMTFKNPIRLIPVKEPIEESNN